MNYKLKINAVFMIALTISGSVFSQTKENISTNQSGPQSFSLKQCLDYALQNQNSIKNATLDEAIAKAKVSEVTAAGLPQVNGNVQMSTNAPLRSMYLPANSALSGFLGGADFKTDGKVVVIPNIFQLANGVDAGLSISQLIFSGSYFVGLQAAKTYKELSSKATEQTKIQVVEAVTKAYYMDLINQERLALFEKNVNRIDSLLMQTKVMYQNGIVESIDVDRIQVAYNNIVTEKENFKNLLLLSQTLLKYQMSMPLGTDMVLTEKIADFKVDNLSIAPDSQKTNYNNRIEYSLLETQKNLQLLDLKNNKALCLPSLAAFGNMGYFSQSPKFDYFSSKNLWSNYGMFGLTMNVPVFSGFGHKYKMQESKLNLKKAENNLSNMELAIDLQVKTAAITLRNSLSTLELQNKNIELANEVSRVTKIKYNQGVGYNLEVLTAETSLKEAQTNYYNALYQALIAKVDYDKATGTLK